MKTNNCLFTNKNKSDTFLAYLINSGYLFQEANGFYSLTTLGTMGLRQLEHRLRKTMKKIQIAEWSMTSLQSQTLWDQSGRDRVYGEELMQVKLRSGKIMRLSATAEEQMTRIVSGSHMGGTIDYGFYQIGNKWRDEIRARSGLIRGREFSMMDAYTFSSEDIMHEKYNIFLRTLNCFLEDLGLEVRLEESDCGEIGGLKSCELQVKTDLDESGWIEVGHSFLLGQKYSKHFDFKISSGEYIWMSCHGLGLTRLLAVLLHQRWDGAKKLLGDRHFSVCDTVLVSLGQSEGTIKQAERIYKTLLEKEENILWENRFKRVGEILTASETLGAKRRIIVSDRLSGDIEMYDFETNSTDIVTENLFCGL